jgi:putative phage-type endonuclease
MSEVIENRNTGIGGSDAAGVVGLSRWKTPLSIWAEKTGQYEVKDEPSLAKTLGTRLEEVVAEMFTEETGKRVARVNERLVHPKYSFINGRIDRRIVGEDAILECKTASAYKAKEWEGEEIPHEYILQCYHYLALNPKWKRIYLAVLIGNQDFKVKAIERDDKVIADLVKKEVDFWENYVLKKVMPSQITSKDAETLYSLYPIAVPGSEVELSDEINKQIESRNAMIQDVKALESQIKLAENEIKAAMKDQELGRSALFIVTWKNQLTKRLDMNLLKEQKPETYAQYVKEIPSRVLRIKEAK